MATLPFDEFARDLAGVFDHVLARDEPVVVERRGARFKLQALPAGAKARTRARAKRDLDYNAFLSSAGGWKGIVDAREFHKRLRQSRAVSPRPRVDL